MLELLTEQLHRAESLSAAQVVQSIGRLTDEHVSVESKAEFLTALAQKGESIDEITAFARELRLRAFAPPIDRAMHDREILDVCGTGGDRLNTFNISTTVALVVASAGVMVAKHGNRAVTSQAGSADVLEALGLRIDLSPEEAVQSLRQHHFAFFFAPRFHPAFKNIGPARKLCAERGQRTIFNILGPLLNPARPSAQLVGVPRPELCAPMARVLQALGVRRGMVVSGAVPPGLARSKSPDHDASAPLFLDEFSTLGENTVAEFYQDRGFSTSTLGIENFSLQAATLADLTGHDRAANAEVIRALLKGSERGPKRDAVLLNAAAALFVAGESRTFIDGWDRAAKLIDSGQARQKLEDLASFK